jgi:hypothetical protein
MKQTRPQVRSDCPPRQLVDFLVSDGSALANQAAAAVQVGQQEEQALLEEIRTAFGAKHVVRVCGSTGGDGSAVIDGAKRLLESAEAIKRSGIDLTGASLAIDDCYEVWGSGFISIPYDFELKDLQPQLTRLLGAGAGGAAAAEGGEGAEVEGGGGGGGGGGDRRHDTITAAVGGSARRRAGAAAAGGAPAFGSWGGSWAEARGRRGAAAGCAAAAAPAAVPNRSAAVGRRRAVAAAATAARVSVSAARAGGRTAGAGACGGRALGLL